jgi:hypothetical protein
MNLMLFIYLCDVLPSLGAFLGVLSLVVFLSAGISIPFVADRVFGVGVTLKLALVAFILGLLLVVLPSQKTMYMMGGAYVAQQAIDSPLVTKVVGIIGNRLDEYLLEEKKEGAK